MTYPSLEAVNLSKKYGSFVALHNLNIKISGNSKCVGFLGPNGAGKTTTLKIFTDLIRPSTGSAFINRYDSHKQRKEALRFCGAVIETPEIYPFLTPKEALSMVGEIKGLKKEEREEEIKRALKQVRMENFADKRIGKFSKGMKQRINLAAALIGNPEILILDEPTSGLDPLGIKEVKDIIRELKKEGKLIFMSSHILSEVSDLCEEVAIINHGKLIAYDKIDRIVSRFSKSNTVDIEISFSHKISTESIRKIRKLKGVLAIKSLGQNRFELKIEGDLKTREEILTQIASMKIGLISFKPSSSALEDVYANIFNEIV
ncbi:MAG: ABC transporter ATP-binding protein [Candidatus Parvarchaeota archaeon]|nr:ABC transporter ATP-binding protein [Candidatus Rehaiarchaeum fermentans]